MGGDDEQSKRPVTRSCSSPFSLSQQQPEQQVDSDLALALALQEQPEQERVFTMLPVESGSEEDDELSSAASDDDDDDDDEEEEDEDEEEEEEEEDDGEYYADYDEMFETEEMDAELHELAEGEDSNTDQEEMEEDDIDPDELSYEDLIALGETVGEENRGLSVEEISSCLSPYTRPSVDTITITIDRCVICQVDYNEGEKLAALPCDHPYHSDCISKWLQIKKICPICGSEVSSSSSSARDS